MRILVDVFDAAGNRVGSGPVENIQSVTIRRELSGAGEISINAPASDLQALENLTNERRIKVYGWNTASAGKRLMGEGIIRKVGIREDASGIYLSVSGPDVLDELKRINTWLGWQRNNQSVASIINDLVALAPGWAADTSAIGSLNPLSVRFDGAAVLKGLQEVIAQTGVHFRLSNDSQTVEVGPMGISNGLIIVAKPSRIEPEMEANDNIAFLERIEFLYDTEAIANKIVPLGPGDAEAALSLKYSTRSSPFTVQSMSVNGQTIYYIENSTSTSTYGAIEKVFQASNISALSNSPADIENAANALYDQAAAWLERYSVRQEVYKVTLRKVTQNIRPGDKIRLEYMGFAVDENDSPVRWVNLRDDFWIVSVTERFGVGGIAVDLELSNIDRIAMNTAQIVVGQIEDLRVANTVVKPYLNKDTVSLPAEAIDNTHDVIFPLTFGEYTTRLNQVIFRLVTRPFRATAQAASAGGGTATTTAGGGNHRHLMFAYDDFNFPWGAILSGYGQYRAASSGAGGDSYLLLPYTGSPDVDYYTRDASGEHTHTLNLSNHTHAITYGIADDTSTPATIRVYVDNVEVSGGPWATSGGNLELELDITNMFDEVNFQGDHQIKVTCGSGQGLVIGQIEVRETIQSIRVI